MTRRGQVYGLAPYTRRPARSALREASSTPWRTTSPWADFIVAERLPTHRALAKALGVDLTTVTRAYGEARRRGLTQARVGQGTFVAETLSLSTASGGGRYRFDLSMNLPPEPLEADLEGRIARGLRRAAARLRTHRFPQLPACRRQRSATAASPPTGCAVACGWPRPPSPLDLARHPDSARRLAACTHPRRASWCSTDALTYPGFKAAAATVGVRLVGVEADAGRNDPTGPRRSLQAADGEGGLSCPDDP